MNKRSKRLPESISNINVDDALNFWQTVTCRFDLLDRVVTEANQNGSTTLPELHENYRRAGVANEFARRYLDAALEAAGLFHALSALARVGFIDPEDMKILLS